jgi:hypothetical protein
MAYDTLIGHFDYGGESYSFVTTTELKFEQYRGRLMTHIGIQTGSEKVRDVLDDIFIHSLKIRIRFDLHHRSVKFPKKDFVEICNCQIFKLITYTFGAQAEIEGYLGKSDFSREKVQFT